MRPALDTPVILYDGVCGLCNRLVQFVLARDSQQRFRFASLQSNVASQVLKKHGITPAQLDTMYLVLNYGQPNEQLAERADAAILILQALGGFNATLASLTRIFPSRLRAWGYNLIARHRYRLYGKFDACPLPDNHYSNRFLDS